MMIRQAGMWCPGFSFWSLSEGITVVIYRWFSLYWYMVCRDNPEWFRSICGKDETINYFEDTVDDLLKDDLYYMYKQGDWEWLYRMCD